MSNEESVVILMEVPAEESKIMTVTQYGMSLPDGSIIWDKDSLKGRTANFKAIHEGDRQYSDNWASILKARAEYSKLDLASYHRQHTPIKREIVVAVNEIQVIAK